MTCYSATQLEMINSSITKEMIGNYLFKLNIIGGVDDFLEGLGITEKPEKVNSDTHYAIKDGKILVIGGTNIKKDKLLMAAGKEGFAKDRFEFVTAYDEAKTYPFEKLKWNDRYSAVIVGPIPHKVTGSAGYSSVISRMQTEEGFPPVVRCGTASDLKITRNSFVNALKQIS